MDETTFGRNQAAKDLARELNENFPHLIPKVGKFISAYRAGLEHISDIVDRTHKIRIAILWRKEFIGKVDFPTPLDTFVKNLLVANYREFLRESNRRAGI